MTCPYYKWRSNFFGGDYFCQKKDSEVNDDIYKRYCRDYSYSDCPIYKGNDGSSGSCYLTTACMVSKGREDNCYELETLRRFRDSYMRTTSEGNQLVEEYYSLAPKIVSKINESEDKLSIYDSIYERVILPCVTLIENNRFEETQELYCKMVSALKEKYC